MKRLYILYDGHCEFCKRLRYWLGRQPAFVSLAFVPFQSAADIFPGIEKLHPEDKLLAISDSGDVWSGDSAWIMTLWALRETREWAQRLASPALRPFARLVCEMLTRNRYIISRWLSRDDPKELHHKLAREKAIEAHRAHEVCKFQ
jgi:predicted DCC family thiol-disulfide oxidoreductase YuxK